MFEQLQRSVQQLCSEVCSCQSNSKQANQRDPQIRDIAVVIVITLMYFQAIPNALRYSFNGFLSECFILRDPVIGPRLVFNVLRI